MKWYSSIGFLLLLCMLVFQQNGQAQSLEETYNFSLEQYELQNHTAAAQGFQRVIFFDSTKVFPKAYQYLADCYLAERKYEQAAFFFDIAATYQNKKDSLQTELIFDKCNALLLQKKFNHALIELYGLDDSLQQSLAVKKDLYFGVAYFGLEDYEQSKNHFLKVSPNSDYQMTIDSLFQENDQVSKLNPMKASYLSMALPGLGQFYSGDLKNGFNSLGLNAILLSAFFITTVNSGLLNAALVIYPWYQRYFIGGFQAARSNAIIIKKERRANIYKELLNEVGELNGLIDE